MKNIRMLLVGLIAGVLLATSATAFAGPALERIAATLRPDYKVKVDGAAVELKYSPIVYNGSTYIPLREAGDILGYNVSFESSTITLNSKKDVEKVSETNAVETPAPEINLSEWILFSEAKQEHNELAFKIIRNPGSPKATLELTYEDKLESFVVDSMSVGDIIYTNENGHRIFMRSSGGGLHLELSFLKQFVGQ